MSKIIGIDLSTTNSCVNYGRWKANRYAWGVRTTPSVCGIYKNRRKTGR